MKQSKKVFLLFILLNYSAALFAQQQQKRDTLITDSLNLTSRIVPSGDLRENVPLLTGNDLTNASFPGSWPMFGTDFRMKIGGYFKADFIADFDGTLDKSQFLMSTIPVKGSPDYGKGGYVYFMSKETRFNIDVRRVSPGAVPLKLFVEGDFFSSSGSPTFRLRHAYVVAGDFIVGQTWTTLSFVESLPFMIDFAAGDALFGGRTTQIRYQRSVNKHLKLAAGIEMLPLLGIENPESLPGEATLRLPLLAFRADYSWNDVLLLFGTSVAQLYWDGGDAGPSDDALQFDVVMAGRKYFGKSTYLTWNISYGVGSGENIMAFGGSNANAVFNANGKLETMPAFALVLGGMHKWSEKLSSNISYAYGWLDPPPSRAPYALKKGGVTHINIIWKPVKQFSTGLEYMWGAQKVSNDAIGRAARLQAMVKFDF